MSFKKLYRHKFFFGHVMSFLYQNDNNDCLSNIFKVSLKVFPIQNSIRINLLLYC